MREAVGLKRQKIKIASDNITQSILIEPDIIEKKVVET